MALAPTAKIILGSVAFAIFWVLAVFPAVSVLPIGRTAGSLLGAMLMVVLRVISPEEAYSAIDLPILGLLFGTMVVSVYLERADMFRYLGRFLSWRSRGGRDLLCRLCLLSALSSALFTNDTSCVVLTEFVLKLSRHHNLPPHPFLLALASSANIGSAATPIGNPQNLVIAVHSGIPFPHFLLGLLPAVLLGLLLNILILLSFFWKDLSSIAVPKADEEAAAAACAGAGADDEDLTSSHRFSPATMSHANSLTSHQYSFDAADAIPDTTSTLRNRSLNAAVQSVVGSGGLDSAPVRMSTTPSPTTTTDQYSKEDDSTWKNLVWKTCVYLVTLGMLVSLLMGLDMSWTAITAALALIVLDFKDARPSLDKVSYSLLIFFCGMFITVDGFNKTGIPSALWDFMEPHARLDSAAGLTLLALVILFLSNVASNVPTVLLLGARVAASAAQISAAEEKRAWLILAWVSTVAGNMSLLGSAANLIVCEQARRAQPHGYNLSFFTHLRFGVPSTLVVTAVGLLLIRRF